MLLPARSFFQPMAEVAATVPTQTLLEAVAVAVAGLVALGVIRPVQQAQMEATLRFKVRHKATLLVVVARRVQM